MTVESADSTLSPDLFEEDIAGISALDILAGKEVISPNTRYL